MLPWKGEIYQRWATPIE